MLFKKTKVVSTVISCQLGLQHLQITSKLLQYFFALFYFIL